MAPGREAAPIAAAGAPPSVAAGAGAEAGGTGLAPPAWRARASAIARCAGVSS